MNLLFRIADLYIPAFIKKRELSDLLSITAAAFDMTAPSLTGLSYDDCLTEFAQFTESAVRQTITLKRDLQQIQDRLFQGAYLFGHKYKQLFRISSTDQILDAAQLLYRILKIDFKSMDREQIIISKCFFSSTYSADTCRIISSLDAGLMAGLSDGSSMRFTARITEGSDCCRAQFIVEGK